MRIKTIAANRVALISTIELLKYLFYYKIEPLSRPRIIEEQFPFQQSRWIESEIQFLEELARGEINHQRIGENGDGWLNGPPYPSENNRND